MEYFINNPKKIKTYGFKARKIVESEYSSEIIINQYLNSTNIKLNKIIIGNSK